MILRRCAVIMPAAILILPPAILILPLIIIVMPSGIVIVAADIIIMPAGITIVPDGRTAMFDGIFIMAAGRVVLRGVSVDNSATFVYNFRIIFFDSRSIRASSFSGHLCSQNKQEEIMKTRNAEELFEALTVEKANIGTYKTQLGFSSDDVDECEHDHANLQAAIANVGIAEADKKSVTKVRNAVYNGDADDSIQPYPAFALTALPFPAAKAGALARYLNRKGRGRLGAGYTEQIGTAIGYASDSTGKIQPEQVRAIIQSISAAAFGYVFALIVAGRGDADMWEVQIQRKGSDTWQTTQSATGKSADIRINPTTPGQPEQILVRVILKKNNQIYGQPSDPAYVTLNP